MDDQPDDYADVTNFMFSLAELAVIAVVMTLCIRRMMY